jgi:SAM-dependent methyltransferase
MNFAAALLRLETLPSKRISKDLVPRSARRWIRRLLRPAFLGTVRRTTPLSRHWGFDRGTPVDRYYIEQFLERHAADIRGDVLEIKDSAYTDRFGTAVLRRDVLDIDPTNPHATIVADLSAAPDLLAGRFDCFILTQTLHMIYDTRAVIRHAHRLLRPGGTLLVTVPVISRTTAPDYWRFTPHACERLFGEIFGSGQVTVAAHGNVLASVAFLEGMAYQELTRRELDVNDEMFPLIVTVRAVKAGVTPAGGVPSEPRP